MRALPLVGGTTAAMFAAATLLFAGLQTAPGKRALAQLAGSLASTEGLTVTVSEIQGFVPADIEVRSIVLSDAHGVFAEVIDLHLAWNPLALLSGTLSVAVLEAGAVTLHRAPYSPSSATGRRLPMMRIALDRVSVPRIVLAEPVFGHAATLALDVSARVMEPALGPALTFDLRRLDREGAVRGALRYAPEESWLDIDISAHEPPGGLFVRAADVAGLPAFDATISGRGTLDDWNGSVRASAGAALDLQGAIRVGAQAKGHRATLDVKADIGGMLPAAFAPLFDGVTQLAIRVDVDDAWRIGIEALTLRAAGLGLSAVGAINARTGGVNLKLHAQGGEAVRFAGLLLPGLSWSDLTLAGSLGGTFAAPDLDATLSARDFQAMGHAARALTVKTRAVAAAQGELVLRLEGTVEGISSAGEELGHTLGERGTFKLVGERSRDGVPALTQATIQFEPFDLRFAGRATPAGATGTLDLLRLDLGALSPWTGLRLDGQVKLEAVLSPASAPGGVAMKLKGRARDVATGIPALDGLFGGGATLAGGLVYGAKGAIAVDSLRFVGNALDIAADGRIDEAEANLSARLILSDLGRLDARLQGRGFGEMHFSGNRDALDATIRLAIPGGTALGQPIENLSLSASIADLTGLPRAAARLDGLLGRKAVRGSAALVTAADGRRVLQDLDLSVGAARLHGALAFPPVAPISGQLALAADDLSHISALTLTELAGRMKADLVFDDKDGRQRLAINAAAEKVQSGSRRVDTALIALTLIDPTSAVALDGSVDLSGLHIGGLSFDKARLTASGTDRSTSLKLKVSAEGATLTATGLLTASADAHALRLDTLRFAKAHQLVSLTTPATITLSDAGLAVDRLALSAASGRALVQGRAGDTLDLRMEFQRFPVAPVALVVPELELSGTLSGTVRIAGPAAAPAGCYDLAVAQLSEPGSSVGPFDIQASGAFGGGYLGVNVAVSSGPSRSELALTGSIPTAGGTLDLAAKGSIGLGLANAHLAVSGIRLAGTAVVDAALRGTLTDPRVSGTVQVHGGRFSDAVNGLTLERIDAMLTGADRSVTLSSFSASTPNGGNVAAAGTIGLDPTNGFPGKLDLTLRNAGLVQNESMRFVADGALAIAGAFAEGPLVKGRIDVRSLDINIPDKLPGGAAVLDVRHVNARPGHAASSSRAVQTSKTRAPSALLANLDLTIAAPNGVFLRGMGMEAELGGDLTVKGTSADPVTRGGFQMRRGRLDVLGKRLDFARGKVTFSGTTDPDLDFVAESTANEVTARVLVSGRVSQPEVTFASTPTLPPDEVIARLLFGRSVAKLTPGQAIQVAQTVAQFSGVGSGMLDSVRRSLGVDTLDVGTDEKGTGAKVGIGRRINDRIYFGVKQGTSPGSSKATIDIDITRNIRIQGATGVDGSGEVGIGAQWDY